MLRSFDLNVMEQALRIYTKTVNKQWEQLSFIYTLLLINKQQNKWPRRDNIKTENTGFVGTSQTTHMRCLQNNLNSVNEDLRTLLPTIVENLHKLSHFKNETLQLCSMLKTT